MVTSPHIHALISFTHPTLLHRHQSHTPCSRSLLPYLVKANPEAAINLIEILVDVSKDDDTRGVDNTVLRRIAHFFPGRVFNLARYDKSYEDKDFASRQ